MSTKRRTATRNDVARQAGVSTAVVSYVVNNGPKPVAATTAARVRAAIELLDYQPNPNAKALRKGSTEILGLLLSDAENPFYTEYAAAIADEAFRRGHALMIGTSRHDLEMENRLIDDLLGRKVDGVIAASVADIPAESLRRFRSDTPIVLLDASAWTPGYAGVGNDGNHGAGLAVDHLASVHGHRRIGIVVGTSRPGSVDSREAGWRRTLQEAGLAEGPLARVAWTRDGGYQAGQLLLDAEEPPEAIFACSDLLAVGVLRAAHERGLDVPRDLAVVGFDGTKESQYSWPPLTVIEQPIAEMAEAAVGLALDPERPSRYAEFKGTLVIRRSCGCPSPP